MNTTAGNPLAVRVSRRLVRSGRQRCAAFVLAACFAAGADANLINFDTSTLAGTSARLDFTLIDGDGDLGNNNVSIAAIATDGTLGGFDCSLGCSGGLPFTINDASGLGQFLQDLTLGNSLSFNLTFSTNFSGIGAPDRLTLLLLDATTNLTLVDTDLDFLLDPVPTQDALLLVDLAPGAQIQLPTATSPNLPTAVIPEPGAASLVGLGLALLAAPRFRRRR